MARIELESISSHIPIHLQILGGREKQGKRAEDHSHANVHSAYF